MLTKSQQKFLLKLKENEMYADEQKIWCKKFFYTNISFLIKTDLVKSRKDYNYNKYIYSLTETGHDLAKIISRIQEVKFR